MILFHTLAKSKFARSIANLPVTWHVLEQERRSTEQLALRPHCPTEPRHPGRRPGAKGRGASPLLRPGPQNTRPSCHRCRQPRLWIKTRRGQAAVLTEDFRSSRGSKTSAQRRNLWKKDWRRHVSGRRGVISEAARPSRAVPPSPAAPARPTPPAPDLALRPPEPQVGVHGASAPERRRRGTVRRCTLRPGTVPLRQDPTRPAGPAAG